MKNGWKENALSPMSTVHCRANVGADGELYTSVSFISELTTAYRILIIMCFMKKRMGENLINSLDLKLQSLILLRQIDG